MLKRDSRFWKEMLGGYAYVVLFFTLGLWILKGDPLWQAFIASCIGSFIFCFVLGAGWIIPDFVRQRRAERRRQAAVSHSQPIPFFQLQKPENATALTLPLVISAKPGWLSYLIATIVMWVLLLPFLLGFWGFKGSFVPTLVFGLAFSFLSSMVLQRDQYRRIEADEEGLTIHTYFSHQSILWREARLFAIDATVKLDQVPDRYELSSATTILRWSRELAPSLTKLSCPFTEYARQMDGLLALIAVKTGLPLSDLRDWRWQQPAPGIISRLFHRVQRFFSRWSAPNVPNA